jgi:hypothetical protein
VLGTSVSEDAKRRSLHSLGLCNREIGYLPIRRTGAMLFFQLLTRCYEHASTILTSNKGFEEWAKSSAMT